jgi:hypothetical protein
MIVDCHPILLEAICSFDQGGTNGSSLRTTGAWNPLSVRFEGSISVSISLRMELPAPKRTKTDGAPSILLIEPFYGGSHKQMLDLICNELPAESFHLMTLPAKKWKWFAPVSTKALYILRFRKLKSHILNALPPISLR